MKTFTKESVVRRQVDSTVSHSFTFDTTGIADDFLRGRVEHHLDSLSSFFEAAAKKLATHVGPRVKLIAGKGPHVVATLRLDGEAVEITSTAREPHEVVNEALRLIVSRGAKQSGVSAEDFRAAIRMPQVKWQVEDSTDYATISKPVEVDSYAGLDPHVAAANRELDALNDEREARNKAR